MGIRYKVVNHDLTTSLWPDIVPLQHAQIVFNQFTDFPSLVVGGGLMIRPEPLRTVGGFAPNLRYGEEGDLFIRLLLKTQIRFANLSEILYMQRFHDSNKSSHSAPVAARKTYAFERRNLSALWDDVTDDTLIRFRRLRQQHKLNWSERRAAKEDLKRVIREPCGFGSDRAERHTASNGRDGSSPGTSQPPASGRSFAIGEGIILDQRNAKRRFGLTENASPLVSVVMSVYNGEKYIAEAIVSILGADILGF